MSVCLVKGFKIFDLGGYQLNAKEGTLIEYVITNNKGSLSERARPIKNIKIKNIDKDYYINKQILPSALRVLGIFGIKEKDLI